MKAKNDSLYDEFYDPTEDLRGEARTFCYDLAIEFIEKARVTAKENWYEDDNTIKGILLLLFTWNFAARKTKDLDFDKIRRLLRETKYELAALESYTIENADEQSWKAIEPVFKKFRDLFGQTGASKALSILNPHLFVMWDTAIRQRLGRSLIPGISNGERPENYVCFLKGIQRIITRYNIGKKIPRNAVLAKKIDEYNYVKIVMEGKRSRSHKARTSSHNSQANLNA